MSARVAVRQTTAQARTLPPLPPPGYDNNGTDCGRDKEEEIYITSASVIELECKKYADNDSYDSGIYNASTNTGCSSWSDKSLKQKKRSPTAGTTYFKSSIEAGEYEEQVVSVWIDLDQEEESTDDDDDDDEECVYESLYDALPDYEDKHHKHQDSSLVKIAEVAGRSIKKLRRNWSIKKDDLSKGLSKIKRSSKTLIEDVYTKEVKFSSVGRRKISLTQLLSTDNPELQKQASNTNFYVNLNQSLPSQVSPQQTFCRANSVLSDISENELLSDFSNSPVSSLPPSVPPSSLSAAGSAPVRPRRRSGAAGKSLTRPSSPPPPPPINLDTHPLNSANISSLAAEISSIIKEKQRKIQDEMFPRHESSAGDEGRLPDMMTEDVKSNCEDTEEIYFSRLMPNEPLYQFYETLPEDVDEKVDLKEEGQLLGNVTQQRSCLSRLSSGDTRSLLLSHTGQRSLWCDMPQVISSGILHTISARQRRLQEAKFEIISSEASYLKSLNVLVSHFANSPKLRHNPQVISKNDWEAVFSNVYQIRECSEKFLQSLETCWQSSVTMVGLSEILLSQSGSDFDVFIEYCSNQVVQERTVKRLKSENQTQFSQVLQELESSEACQSLSLHSFLMLPMQRITRLPLLVTAIITHSDEPGEFQECLETLNRLVSRCNEGARHRERQEELVKINTSLDFKLVPWVYLVTPARYLVKQTQCTRICWKDNADKLTFGKKVSKQSLVLLLFTDLLLVCKKKREEKMTVIDYCQRNLLDLSAVEMSTAMPGLCGGEGDRGAWLTLIQNSDKRTSEMIIIFQNHNDRKTWIDLVKPKQELGEKIYDSWDCPRVEAVEEYQGEVSLRPGDEANVLRKKDEGSVYIEKVGGGSRGWVPGWVVRELESDHRRAKNFKQRYQFLKALAEIDMAES